MKRAFRYIITAVLVLGVLFVAQRVVMPKYFDGILEGAMVAEYYKEADKSFDVLFVGDCEVYENFSPQALWDEYGINSYIRGSAEQYIWQSYYLLEDCLSFYKPHTVIFNIQSLQFNTSQSEAYNRMSIDGMKWSRSKIGAIKASMKEEEHFIEYVFPLLRYHSRWSELTANDFLYAFKEIPNVAYNGYYMRIDVRPAENVPEGKILADYSFGEKAWEYLDNIRTICEVNDINLILIKAPSLYPYWYDEYEAQVEAYAEKYDLPYINFLEIGEETGIDYNLDTYDAGLHMNLSGAEKLSHYIGGILAKNGVPDRRNEKALSESWDKKRELYNAEIENQKVRYGL